LLQSATTLHLPRLHTDGAVTLARTRRVLSRTTLRPPSSLVASTSLKSSSGVLPCNISPSALPWMLAGALACLPRCQPLFPGVIIKSTNQLFCKQIEMNKDENATGHTTRACRPPPRQATSGIPGALANVIWASGAAQQTPRNTPARQPSQGLFFLPTRAQGRVAPPSANLDRASRAWGVISASEQPAVCPP